MHNLKHKKVIDDAAKFLADIDALVYANSNEKSLLRGKLERILAGHHYNHAIDLGAGPGLLSDILERHAKRLTLIEMIQDYYPELKNKFPNATIKIQSILDMEFSESYDLILFSHVLYYIDSHQWEDLLTRLYQQLTPGGKLIVIHSPFHEVQNVFKDTKELYDNVAYLDQAQIDLLMNRVGFHNKDHFIATNYFYGELNREFAKKFAGHFYGVKELPEIIDTQLDALLKLFRQIEQKVAIEYQNDIYIFSK